jgi:hypothetical protein
VIASFDELTRFAEAVSKSGLAPKGMESAPSIFVAIQMGLEVGLSPMAALQNIAVVNGRPTIWGDAQLAVCRGTGEMEEFEEWFEVGGQKTTRNPSEYKDDTAAVCKVKRRGGGTIESAFSVADAKRANLWGKAGPWTQYPFRMLRNRARSFALRDCFGDALKGFRSTEEARDDQERDVTPQAEQSALFTIAPKAEAFPVDVEAPAKKEAAKKKPTAEVMPAEELPMEVKAEPSPIEQVRALIAETKITWRVACEILNRNAIFAMDYATPEEATEMELTDSIKFWPAIVKLAKQGGSK